LWAAAFATVVVLVALLGSSQRHAWAGEAVQWIEARDRAHQRSVPDLLMFEPADTVHRVCCHQTPPIQGRQALAAVVRSIFGDDGADEQGMWGSYIDVSGVVVAYLIRGGPFVYLPADGSEPVGPDEIQVMTIADGAATETIHATSVQFLQAPAGDGREAYGTELAAVQPLIGRYLAAWSTSDSGAVEALYGEDASFLDTLLGINLSGSEAIGSYAVDHAGARLEPVSIPGGGGPALFGFWRQPRGQGALTAYLAYSGDDGNRCPGSAVTALDIKQDRIIAERRYHDIASIRRCVDSTELQDGWWTRVSIPAQIEDQVTGTVVTSADYRVQVRNGFEGADELVGWAIDRFDTAGLTAPAVASITFTEVARQPQCSQHRGLAFRDDTGFRIYLCLSPDRVDRLSAQDLLLHELAHVWMWENLDTSTQEQFLARMDLSTWDSVEVPWGQRGEEQAAEVIEWGLTDRPVRQNQMFPETPCTQLAATFTLLTEVPPIRPACPPSLEEASPRS
jgi:hypothetical protein